MSRPLRRLRRLWRRACDWRRSVVLLGREASVEAARLQRASASVEAMKKEYQRRLVQVDEHPDPGLDSVVVVVRVDRKSVRSAGLDAVAQEVADRVRDRARGWL